MWRALSLDGLWQDVSYAIRNVRRHAGFTATVVLVLAVVIGLNTTFFTVLAGIALRPWPGIGDPARVVRVYLVDQSGQAAGFSLADARTLAEQARAVEGVAAMENYSVRLGADDGRVAVDALLVSGDFFDLLGIGLAQGRGIRPDEDRPGAPGLVTVLGYDFWQSRFGGDPGIVGTSLRINDVLFTIVGVASREFTSAEPAYDKHLFLPISAVPVLRPEDPSSIAFVQSPSACCVDVVARLADGATRAQAQAEIEVLGRAFASFSGTTARGAVVTGTEFLSQPGRGDSASALLTATLLTGALLLVWLIACANIGNLQLARAAARSREIGIRLALGAGRARLVRQLLTEGFVMALAAGAIGIGIAYQLPFVVFRIVAESGTTGYFPFSVTPDAVVLGYAVLFAGLSAVMFGLAPALYITRTGSASALNQREVLPTSRFPLRGVLLAVQVAVSVVLLVSASLLVRGVQQQAGAFDPGFSVDQVTAVSFTPPEGVYDRARTTAFFAALTQGLGEMPIEGFAFSSHEPFSRFRNGTVFHLPGENREQARTILYLDVSPGYLDLLGIPLVRGRSFEPADAEMPRVIVNESMARRYWPGEDPVGKTFFLRPRGPVNEMAAREVVGVVRDVHTSTSDTVPPMFYRPVVPGAEVFGFISSDPRASQAPTLILKGAAASSDAVVRLAARLDSRMRVRATPLSAALDTMLRSARWGPILAAVLGAFGLALATVGLFGVFAFAVRQRSREIGIRMALGAGAPAVVRLVVTGHARAVAVGLIAGLLGAVAASIVLESRLHGLSRFDPLAYLAVASLLAGAALAATYLPVRRATRLSPLEALRQE